MFLQSKQPCTRAVEGSPSSGWWYLKQSNMESNENACVHHCNLISNIWNKQMKELKNILVNSPSCNHSHFQFNLYTVFIAVCFGKSNNKCTLWWMSGVVNVWGGERLGWWMSGVVNVWFYTGGGERLGWWMSGWWTSYNHLRDTC